MTEVGIRVEGLAEFRRALREVQGRAPRELTAALKRAGEPAVRAASARAPRLTGALASSYTARVRGSTGEITSRVPYGAGAEWGVTGKWRGFAGSPPRYVWPAVEQSAPLIERTLSAELEDIFTILGWAQ